MSSKQTPHTNDMFPDAKNPPRKERCRQCKWWAMAKNNWEYGYGVCTLRPTKRNQFGYERQSGRAMACVYFEQKQKENND